MQKMIYNAMSNNNNEKNPLENKLILSAAFNVIQQKIFVFTYTQGPTRRIHSCFFLFIQQKF